MAIPAAAACSSGDDNGGGSSQPDAGGGGAEDGGGDSGGDAGGSGDPEIQELPGGPDMDLLPGASLVGRAVIRAGALVFVDPADGSVTDPGAGGASVAVRDMFGGEVTSATADAEGRFQFDSLARGFLTLTVSSSGVTDATAEVSSCARCEITLGQVTPVTRDAAIETVVATLTGEELVLGLMQPLVAGTVVAPIGVDPETSELARTLAAPAWLFVVDPTPGLRWSHEVVYHFVDAASGAVDTVVGAMDMPRINRGLQWNDDVDYVAYPAPASEDAPPEEWPEGEAISEVVRTPTVWDFPGETFAWDGAELREKLHNDDPESFFLAMFRAGDDSTSVADLRRMRLWANRMEIPMENRRVVESPEARGPRDISSAWLRSLQELNAAMQTRLDAGEHSTLIVYITGHGLTENGEPTGEVRVDWRDRTFEWRPRNFDPANNVTGSPACRVVPVIDVCFAGKTGEVLTTHMETVRPENERPDWIVLASSRADQKSVGIPGWLSTITLGVVGEGSNFTHRFVENVTLSGSGLSGALNGDESDVNDNLDPVGQDPVAIVRHNEPARCLPGGGGDDTGTGIDGGDDAGNSDASDEDASSGDADPGDTSGETDDGTATGPVSFVPLFDGPEGMSLLRAGTSIFDPPLFELATTEDWLFIGATGGLQIVSPTRGPVIGNPYVGDIWGAHVRRTPMGWDQVLMPSPRQGLVATSWDPDYDDFGMTQMDPSGGSVSCVDIWFGSGPTQSRYLSVGGSRITVLGPDGPTAEYDSRLGSLDATAFPGNSLPSPFISAAFGTSETDLLVALENGELWRSPLGPAYGEPTFEATSIGPTAGGARFLRCEREGGRAICVLSGFGSGTVWGLAVDASTAAILGSAEVPGGPVESGILLDGPTALIAAPSWDDNSLYVFRFDPFSGEFTPLRSFPDICEGPGHAMWGAPDRIYLTCNLDNRLAVIDLSE